MADVAREPARLVWVESPTNPLLRIIDIARLRRLADACGALLVVDNTFLVAGAPAAHPPRRRPRHSLDDEVHQRAQRRRGWRRGRRAARNCTHEMQAWANALGLTGAPFDSYLTLRGVRTLFVRMRQHEANAARPGRAAVVEPGWSPACSIRGLPGHPGHDIARRQQQGFGGMLSFELRGGPGRRAGLPGDAAAVFAGRVPGRRGEPGLPPGDDDPRAAGSRGAQGGWDRRRTGASVGRDRSDRGPAGRCAPRAGGGRRGSGRSA